MASACSSTAAQPQEGQTAPSSSSNSSGPAQSGHRPAWRSPGGQAAISQTELGPEAGYPRLLRRLSLGRELRGLTAADSLQDLHVVRAGHIG